MDTAFSENLSKLRKERGLNQRKAAAELKISQALLSHYENGIREPGLDFVVRVCEYYSVSADYMLGRTNIRETVLAGGADGAETSNDKIKQEVIAFAAVLFRVLEQTDQDIAEAALDYMTTAEYNLLRYLFACSDNNQFSLPPEQSAALCDVDMKLLTLKLCGEIRKRGIKISSEPLKKGLSKTTYKSFESSALKLEERLVQAIK